MVEQDIFMLEKIKLSDFKQPFRIDITEEFNEMKKAYNCKICHNLLVQPVILNTCRHMLCYGCLDTKFMRCLICKYPYTKTDICHSNISETIIQCLKNIESISKEPTKSKNLLNNRVGNTTFLGDKYEFVIAQTTMKKNAKGETPLHLACKKGNVAKVEELIKSGVDINATDWGNWSALHEAVEGKHVECVKLLLKNGVLINIPGVFYMTPLHEAVSLKMKNIAVLLLKYGADKEALNNTGQTPLDYICDDKQMLAEFESIEPVKKYKPKIFFKKEITVYSESLDVGSKILLKKFDVHVATLQCYEQKNESNITHFIISKGSLTLNILIAILKGIFIVDKQWMEILPPEIYPFEFISETYKLAVKKSIQNAIEHKPKLFSGINFHVVDHDEQVQIYTAYFTKKDLKLLIEIGGGNIVSRCPTLLIAQNGKFQPYHADTKYLKQCSNYIIFDESKVHELMYAAKELRHRSSKWLIDCILQFKILE